MARFLIIYSTTDGHTREICDALCGEIADSGHQVSQLPIEQADSIDPAAYDRIVIGARIRYGKHSPLVVDFINRHHAVLARHPNALFSVNIVARKPEKNTPATNPYLKQLLQQIRWQPAHLEVFAGKLDYPRYGPLDRLMIRFIMLITKGPTNPDAVVDFTDWDKVRAFGRLLGRTPTSA